MYEAFKDNLKARRKSLAKVAKAVKSLETKGINLEKYVRYVHSDHRVLIMIRNDYEEILEILQVLSTAFKVPAKFNHSWGGDDIKFSWTLEDIPIDIWGVFNFDKVPEELLRGCQIKEITKEATTEYAIACEV